MAVSGYNKAIKIKSSKGFSMELKGYSQVLRNLALTKNQKANLQKFLEDEANKVIRTAKSIVPIDTGRLKDSHRIMKDATKRDMIRADIVVGGIIIQGRFVGYATAVHEGSPSYPARPWLAAAIQAHASGYKNRLAKAIKLPKGKRL